MAIFADILSLNKTIMIDLLKTEVKGAEQGVIQQPCDVKDRLKSATFCERNYYFANLINNWT